MVPDRQASAAGGDAQTPSDPATPRTRDPADRTTTVGATSVHGRLDQVPTALVTTDRDGDIRYSNLAARELLDPQRAGLARENLLDLAVDEDRAAVARAHHLALGGQRRPPYVVRLRTGTRQSPLLLAAAPPPPGDGAREMVWAIVRPGLWDVEGEDGRLTGLASALCQLSRMSVDRGVCDVVPSAASACQSATGPDSRVSLTLRLDGHGEVGASTSRSTLGWEKSQLTAGQGPTLLAAREAAVVRTTDVAADPRFPGLKGTIPPGLCVVSSPLMADGTLLGVLTAYDVDRSLLDPGDTILPSLVTAIAAIAAELQARTNPGPDGGRGQ